MATIDSVKFYMSRAEAATGWNLLCSIRLTAVYTSHPGNSVLLGSSDAVAVDSVPLHGSQDWVTFTFSTPITISGTGFYAVQVWSSQPDYQHARVYIYDSDNWVDASGGTPLSGDERGWRYDPLGHSWGSGNIPAYQVICTDNDGNDALTPLATYNTLGGYNASDLGCTAVRSFITVLPSKPITPAPSDTSTTVTLDQTTLTWEDGGGADTYSVYFGPSGNMTLQSSAQVGLSWDIDILPFSYNVAYQWRIDATNIAGTTTGDTWSFNTIAFAPPVVGGSNWQIIKRLVAAANDKFWYEDI